MVAHLQTVILYRVQVARRKWSKELRINQYLDNSLAKELEDTWIERYIGGEEEEDDGSGYADDVLTTKSIRLSVATTLAPQDTYLTKEFTAGHL